MKTQFPWVTTICFSAIILIGTWRLVYSKQRNADKENKKYVIVSRSQGLLYAKSYIEDSASHCVIYVNENSQQLKICGEYIIAENK